MKKTMIGMVLLFLAAFSPALALPAGAMVDEGIFDQVSGRVTVQRLDGGLLAAKAGDLIEGGEIVETGPSSSARILLPDQSVIELKENTRIEVNDSRANVRGVSSVLLYLGRLWGNIAQSPDGETSFEVVTSSAVAGVRGTVFSAGVGLDGATRIGVEQGEVEVQGEAGSPVLVKAGQETSIDLGAKPQALSPYQKSEDQWRQWLNSRQQAIMAKADVLPDQVMKNIQGPRQRFEAQAAEMKRLQGQWQAYAQKQERQGRPVRATPAVRREVILQMRAMFIVAKQLQRADNRMVASYFLVERLDQDMQAHPDQYSPELRAKIHETAQKLDAMDLGKLHRQNLYMLDKYAEGLEQAVSKWNLNPELKRRIEAARRAGHLRELQRARMQKQLKEKP